MTGQLSAMHHGYSGDRRMTETYFVFVDAPVKEKNRNLTSQKSSYNEILKGLTLQCPANTMSVSLKFIKSHCSLILFLPHFFSVWNSEEMAKIKPFL